MRFLVTFLLSSFLLNAFAQRQNVYYLKNNGRSVLSRDSADYIRIVREPDSGSVLYKVMEYYANGVLKFVGSSSEVEPVRLEGTCINYFKTGKRETIFNYRRGYKFGNQFYYHANGQLLENTYYPDSINLYKEVYRVVALNDSTGKEMVVDGNGHYIGYDESLKKIISEGDIKNGVKHGKWVSSIKNDSIITTENYNEGLLINGTAKFANGDVSTYKEANKLPQFPGGIESLGYFLGKQLRYPEEALRKDVMGRVEVAFFVEPDGSLSNIAPVGRKLGAGLEEEATRVIKLSPKWIPATQYGRAIRHSYKMPIVFSVDKH